MSRLNVTTSQKPKARRQPQAPSTSDEWLAAGVELEEAAEKWRAGDAAKSARFFNRAIENYDLGLGFFPNSFDLAYNKARIQFQITQYPRLLSEVRTSYLELLSISLVSHRYALNLDSGDPDCLFNTAQILTLLADAKDQSEDDEVNHLTNQRGILEEALQLQQRCYAIQQQKLNESQQFQADLALHDGPEAPREGGVSLDTDEGEHSQRSGDQSQPDEAWAAIEEPMTIDTLVDTAIAMFETLLALSEVVEAGQELQQLERLGSSILNSEVEATFLGLRSQQEGFRADAILANSRFTAGLLVAGFRTSNIALDTARERITAAFEEIAGFGNPPQSESAAFLNAYADALVDFELQIAEHQPSPRTQWDILSKALDIRTKATKVPNADRLSLVHAGRGDIELRRYQISASMELPETLRSSSSRTTLLKNSGVYYRAASAFARKDGANTAPDENHVIFIKEAMVACMDSSSISPLAELVQTRTVAPHQIASTLKTAHRELLISDEIDQRLNQAMTSEMEQPS